MSVDEYVVAGDVGELGRDVADAAHVGSEIVDLSHVTGGLQSIVPEAEIEEFEFIGRAGLEFRLFDVDTANPVAVCLELFHQMMTNEAARSGDQYASC